MYDDDEEEEEGEVAAFWGSLLPAGVDDYEKFLAWTTTQDIISNARERVNAVLVLLQQFKIGAPCNIPGTPLLETEDSHRDWKDLNDETLLEKSRDVLRGFAKSHPHTSMASKPVMRQFVEESGDLGWDRLHRLATR